ncbi:hypothetical protein MAPG_05852 [Magnaporthiopsis poae ATCC 64411]|uniref:Major facilitator superfamily (MFS) profile domain-containing protein n=1 Tax=Magnaporthiopsis poae (strain ATCC 64411 / 73-15) TaxID=644358 RepID=A0A0C4E0H9_MAGP6|nr:hypothetical protein MAPG_05852 [Magnaporthiopsis poae ATCC 64411]
MVQRAVRLTAYGSSTLVLLPHLRALGASEAQCGVFLSLTLAGDTLLSLLLTLVADALGRRAVLAAGAAVMALSGLAFVLSESYWVLLAAAVLGVISPTANETGPFRSIEESVVAQLTAPTDRADVYAWYKLLGFAAVAVGMAAGGWLVQLLQDRQGWSEVAAYQAVFASYAACGLVKFLLCLFLTAESEAQPDNHGGDAAAEGEREPLLGGGSEENRSHDAQATAAGPEQQQQQPPRQQQRKGLLALLPEIGRESRIVVINLCLLFTLDSFASSLVSVSWISYFFKSRHGLEPGALGSVFFVTGIIGALSMLVAASLARRIGNINTMVFTHLPSSIMLALIPLGPLHVALIFLFLRHCTASMDVGPRSAFLAAIVLPSERTAVLGILNTTKTLGQSLGPLITGVLADRGFFWVAFVLAGSLKASYDIGMLVLFKNHEREKAELERLLDGPVSDGDDNGDENESGNGRAHKGPGATERV